MRPAKPDAAAQPDMVRETLEAILDPRHELLELGRRIDWAKLDAACGETFVDQAGRPGLPTRLMAGLHILKHVKGLSDEALSRRLGREPLLSGVLRRAVLPAPPAARSQLHDPLAQAHRA